MRVKKRVADTVKEEKIMLPSSLYISSIMLPLYMNNIKDCLRKVYRLLILNVYIILRKSNSTFYQWREKYDDTE